MEDFNPRTRVGCDVTLPQLFDIGGEFQSTHPRGVRPFSTGSSIMPQKLFQSTHPRGVRPHYYQDTLLPLQFQSTHPRGVRLKRSLTRRRSSRQISIHAPAWGATSLPTADDIKTAIISIHAPAWGATADTLSVTPPCVKFQSTHPRGVRRTHLTRRSRLRSKFQSTHPRGVRRRPAGFLRWGSDFNPRTRVGCDNSWPGIGTLTVDFNPRTRVGCDQHE